MESRLDKGITYVITRKVCPSACKNAGGLPFFRGTVFRKRYTETLFEAQCVHFNFS